jgi:uncharacterized protein involved in exopolysaccharide biosynthesis
MDFAPGLRLVQRWWPVILAVTVLAAVLAYAASYLMAPSYSSAARVLVRARDARFLTSTGEDVASRPGAIDLVPPKTLNQTLAGLATSRAVAEQVVTELKLDQPRPVDTSFFAPIKSAFSDGGRRLLAQLKYGYYAEPSAFEGAVEELRNSIVATPIKDSYLIEIRVRSSNPELATAAAEAATRAFVRQSSDEFQRNAAKYRTTLADEVERARGEVDGAEAALKSYKERHKIVDVTEAMRLSAADEDALRQQLREVEADLDGARARHVSLRNTLAGLSPTERSTTSATGQNTTSVSSTAEAGRGATTTVNDTTTGNSETRNTVAPNRVYQDVQRDAATLAAQIAGLEAKRTALSAALADRPRANAELAEHAAQINALELQRNSAHATYTAIRSSYENSVVNDARGAQEVSQVDAATRPLYPDRPVRSLFAFFGLLCGLAGGAGLALLFDRWQPTWSRAARSVSVPAGAPAAIWTESPSGAQMTPAPTAVFGQRPAGRYEI